MHIGILQTGLPPSSLEPDFGRYDAMMARMLGDGFTTTTFDVTAGAFPRHGADFDGYIVTGSSAGVYDPLPWIEPLKQFLREAERRTKIVGICFGHQIMAEAFGGRVEKSPKGWGLGVHTYDLACKTDWMDKGSRVSVAASHQDQVVEPPASATVLGSSAFTPFGILSYEDRNAISFQFHPEFDPAFSEALIELRRTRMASDEEADRAIASLREANDSQRVAGWIRSFFRG